MKWKFNPKTGRMEQEKRTGVEVSARQGGIMVEDFDRHIQFLINYGTSKITHCFGSTRRSRKALGMIPIKGPNMGIILVTPMITLIIRG